MKKRCIVLLLIISVLTLVITSCNTGGQDFRPTWDPNSIPPEPTSTPTPVQSPTPEVTPEASPTTSPTPEPSPTPTPTPTPEPSATPEPTPSPEPTQAPGTVELPVVRGIYLTEGNVADRSRFDKWLKLARETEINAFVINVKNDMGYLVYDSQNELAAEAGAVAPMFNVAELVEELHDNGIYAIARVVCFKDDVMGNYKPEWALKKTDGTNFREYAGGGKYTTWMNASVEEAGKYIVEVAREVLEKGFDEVQFDYIRFPGNGHGVDYSAMNEPRESHIADFVNYAAEQLAGYALSADIFGITCIESYDAGGIGQTLAVFGDNVDAISPMIYPSHYANSSNRTMGNGIGSMINGNLYEKPDLEPYGVVYDTLAEAAEKIAGIEDYKAAMRPYIQGFTATYLPDGYWTPYDADKFRQQIQAVYDAGYDSWIFWDSSPSYTADMFEPSGQAQE